MLKVSLSALVFAVSFLAPNAALSAVTTKITGVAVKRSAAGVSIDVTFDRPVSAKALKPGFERNFVQLVLKSSKIDAAKIVQVDDSEVQKVFTYPYNPETARLRVILKKDGEWAKGRISLWNNNPRSVRVFIKDPLAAPAVPAPKVAETPKKPAPQSAPAVAEAAPKITEKAAEGTIEEKTLLKEVLTNTRDIDINNPDSVKAALKGSEKTPLSAVDKTSADEKSGNVGTKSDPTRHFGRMALALFGVLGLFVGIVLLVKRYAGNLKKLPFGKKERLIQVVATHYLGNKKSISLVKVTGEYMVVGVSNDGISLITKLGAEVDVEKYIEDRFWGGTFEKHLDTYAKDQKVAKEIDLSDAAPAETGKAKFLFDGARDLAAPVEAAAKKVQDKVEISPVRASIKEKLTKLKPLA